MVQRPNRTFNPFTPKGDEYLNFSYNIIPESNIKVMRIKQMITKEALDC